tara:strand:+ start:253 stop:609 length:357 start_codon:yes stop_codon:yes gene_type:complete
MILIILASIFAGLGTYILREGNFIEVFLSIIKLNIPDFKLLSFTFLGIILNLIAISLWQYSGKGDIPFNIALSIYLSSTIVVGSLIDFLIGDGKFDLNFILGTIFIISGIIISNKSSS